MIIFEFILILKFYLKLMQSYNNAIKIHQIKLNQIKDNFILFSNDL